jgi:MFS transporter, SHS family, lactate transporter
VVAAGEHDRILVDGQRTPNYAYVQGIFIGVVAVFTLLMTILGPECVIFSQALLVTDLGWVCRNHGSRFEKHKTAYEEGGRTDTEEVVREREGGTPESGSVDEKGRYDSERGYI